MRKVLGLLFALVWLASISTTAMAHGSLKPKHGGIVESAHDLVFELVQKENKTELYVRDHGKPYSTDSLSGSLIFMSESGKRTTKLVANESNKMTANTTLPESAKVIVRVKNQDGKNMLVRFSL